MIVCMAAATVLLVIFAVLFLTAGDGAMTALLVTNKEQETRNVQKYRLEIAGIVNEMKETNNLTDKKLIKRARTLKKKMDASEKRIEDLEAGKIGLLDMIPLAGYRLMQMMKWDAATPAIKKLNRKCGQIMIKREAINESFYLYAAMFGYILLGAFAFFLLMAFGLINGIGSRSLVVGAAGLIVFSLIGYVPYDEVNETVRKRGEEIERQFPQVVSKMALLTVAGMEVNQAWQLASSSGKGTLYDEMKRVLVDFDNNVSPTVAYGGFIDRCDNKYTTKLATAILQNISKGNSEIVKLFRDLNDESWLEHKHNARRMGEKIQSKLMVPTLLMFLGILILVIVPVMSGFNM